MRQPALRRLLLSPGGAAALITILTAIPQLLSLGQAVTLPLAHLISWPYLAMTGIVGLARSGLLNFALVLLVLGIWRGFQAIRAASTIGERLSLAVRGLLATPLGLSVVVTAVPFGLWLPSGIDAATKGVLVLPALQFEAIRAIFAMSLALFTAIRGMWRGVRASLGTSEYTGDATLRIEMPPARLLWRLPTLWMITIGRSWGSAGSDASRCLLCTWPRPLEILARAIDVISDVPSSSKRLSDTGMGASASRGLRNLDCATYAG